MAEETTSATGAGDGRPSGAVERPEGAPARARARARARGRASKRPHDVLRLSTAFSLRFVSRLIEERCAEALGEYGLGWQAFLVLVVAAEVDGLSGRGLAERTGLDRTTVGATLEELEDEGLAERARDPWDGRQRRVRATAEGRRCAAEAREVVARAEHEVLRGLSAPERRLLQVLLARLVPAPLDGILDLLQPRSMSSIR